MISYIINGNPQKIYLISFFVYFNLSISKYATLKFKLRFLFSLCLTLHYFPGFMPVVVPVVVSYSGSTLLWKKWWRIWIHMEDEDGKPKGQCVGIGGKVGVDKPFLSQRYYARVIATVTLPLFFQLSQQNFELCSFFFSHVKFTDH